MTEGDQNHRKQLQNAPPNSIAIQFLILTVVKSWGVLKTNNVAVKKELRERWLAGRKVPNDSPMRSEYDGSLSALLPMKRPPKPFVRRSGWWRT
jgi:hypothetical protein